MERLSSSLVLSATEEGGLALPAATWVGHSEEDEELLLVGRLLTPRVFRFDVLWTTLMNVLRPIKGMSVRLLEHNRFLLQFNHVVDRDRDLNGGPWLFDKNVIILQKVSADVNPIEIELNWCSFYVFIHGLPLRMMTKEVAEYIENRLGKFIDSDHDQAQFKWGPKVRIRVALNVCQPLTRMLRLYSMGGDEEYGDFYI
ncbi:UNVERIFIED_CONTAM: hypothetical protein Slati_2363800 [Sesamum latifolium]|uniref:DUF4283 domain-containing protein n=1 Tax=Sesamum latifolium TaxID=2727402 RepID=A0AAW2WAX3_9LAMI